MPAGSVPNLEDFHVSCLPSEGFSSVETHRYLHLTKATIHYLTENFHWIQKIAGIESWNPRDTNRESLNAMLNHNSTNGDGGDCNNRSFAVISI